MGLRERVMRWLDRGDAPPEPAPDTRVEIENVRLVDGPIVVAQLEEAAIVAEHLRQLRAVLE